MKMIIYAAMRFSLSPETLLSSLGIMVEGMLGIFAVIVVVWLFVLLLGRVTGKKGGTK